MTAVLPTRGVGCPSRARSHRPWGEIREIPVCLQSQGQFQIYSACKSVRLELESHLALVPHRPEHRQCAHRAVNLPRLLLCPNSTRRKSTLLRVAADCAWPGQGRPIFTFLKSLQSPKSNILQYSLSIMNDLIHPDVLFTLKPTEGDLPAAGFCDPHKPRGCTVGATAAEKRAGSNSIPWSYIQMFPAALYITMDEEFLLASSPTLNVFTCITAVLPSLLPTSLLSGMAIELRDALQRY